MDLLYIHLSPGGAERPWEGARWSDAHILLNPDGICPPHYIANGWYASDIRRFNYYTEYVGKKYFRLLLNPDEICPPHYITNGLYANDIRRFNYYTEYVGKKYFRLFCDVNLTLKTLRCSIVEAKIIAASRQEWKRVVRAIRTLMAPTAVLSGRTAPPDTS
ncbi:hypothetical protein Aduo_006876 [Ancylostoma duodenale]